MSGDLYQLEPDNVVFRRLYLTAMIQSAKLVGGLDQPLSSIAAAPHEAGKRLGVDVIEDVLVHAMKEKHVPAAIGAVGFCLDGR